MPRCPECRRRFPQRFIQQMFVSVPGEQSGYIQTCPLCALTMRNESAGLPKDTPFTGTMARALHEEATAWVATHG